MRRHRLRCWVTPSVVSVVTAIVLRGKRERDEEERKEGGVPDVWTYVGHTLTHAMSVENRCNTLIFTLVLQVER